MRQGWPCVVKAGCNEFAACGRHPTQRLCRSLAIGETCHARPVRVRRSGARPCGGVALDFSVAP
jgi:hypothetical protein